VGLDTNGDGIADQIAAVQGSTGTSNQIRYFTPSGTLIRSTGGFIGPWYIAALHKAIDNLFANYHP